jgi:hypothetical protein
VVPSVLINQEVIAGLSWAFKTRQGKRKMNKGVVLIMDLLIYLKN